MRRLIHRPQDRSGVLVLTLLVLVLVSMIVLGLLASVTMERQSTEANYQQRRALSLAMLGFHTGVQQLREALGTNTQSWDNPFGNFTTNAAPFFWSVSPGIVSRWSYTSVTPVNYPLFSYTSDLQNTNLVDLNRPLADGTYPIIGLSDAAASATTPPSVQVQFVNVLQDPTQAPSRNNQITGRYAFWIDDENSKININVADGSRTKYTPDWMTNSLGLGSPTEESLTVLPQGGAGSFCSQTTAANIVAIARTTSFHSPREILKAGGATADLFTNNVFDLTDNSRSPDINIFGQIKMAILPLIGSPMQSQSNEPINGISLLPETELYPTEYQLASILAVNTTYYPPYGIYPPQYINLWFPHGFRCYLSQDSMGDYEGLDHDLWAYTVNNYAWGNGWVLSHYLDGYAPNAWPSGPYPITWPVFPINSSSTTSTNGFAGKYSQRQMDEIAIQITNLGSKLIGSDYYGAWQTDFPSCNVLAPGHDEATTEWFTCGYGECTGSRFANPAYLWQGWLSHQWVIGIGRTPKVSRMAISVQSTGAVGTPGPMNAGYTPPYANVNFWLEEWIPGAFRGGNLAGLGNPNFSLGSYNFRGLLNPDDINIPYQGGIYPAYTANPNGTGGYWYNQVLTNNQGIDFNANTSDWDPDPTSATNWHSPWAKWDDVDVSTNVTTTTNADATTNFLTNVIYTTNTVYHSANYLNGGGTPFSMHEPENDGEWEEFQPGTLRSVQSNNPNTPLYMQANASGQQLIIGGGLQVLASTALGANGNGMPCDPDPTPLEAKRGMDYPFNPTMTDDHIDDTNWAENTLMPGASPSPTNLFQRNIASVIPVALTNTVPGPVLAGHVPNQSGINYNYMTCADPLVNKFPGDWTTYSSPPSGFFDLGASTPGEVYASYPDSTFVATLQDPDSYWLPQMDCPIVYTQGTPNMPALQSTHLIPRSARMPNIGYLQYIRTGIIPDDETNTPYAQQHGTPFRLLSLSPLDDSLVSTSQQTTASGSQPYPDWAMLDLLFVPSILYSFGGPYAGQTNLASFGTYGGATAGRINPNGMLIYTTNATIPRPDVTRLLPMEATFNGLMVNQHFTGSSTTPAAWGYSGGSAVDAPTLAQAVAAYLRQNGPLRMPSEICNIPALGDTPNRPAATVNPTGTRNDLLRQMLGELTTQSDTFSVWTVGQVVQKIPANTTYGEFQPGDQITGEVRLHLIVERYLDPGADGVYGDTPTASDQTSDYHGAGNDGVVGTMDDGFGTANNPSNPKFLYRVVRAEELR